TQGVPQPCLLQGSLAQMVIYLLALLLIAACGIGMRPVLRGAFGVGVTVTRQSVEVAHELPADLQHLPEPPVLPAAAVQILERAAIFRRLRELELGISDLGQPM